MNAKKYKMYEEIAKVKGKMLFVEESLINLSAENIVQSDKTKMIEGVDGKSYEARGILKNVPTARYDTVNANGRIYPGSIGQKIEESKIAEGSDCYGNHAENDDSVFDLVGIWRNYHYKEGIGYADLYCIGDGGQFLFEKVKAGGRAGFSTVAYGSLQEDNKTVDPNTFEIDVNHYCDWVGKPSASVYATYENIQESVESKDNILIESKTNNISKTDIEKETLNEDENKRNTKMLDKLTEASLKNQVRIAIKEAKSSPKMKDAIEDLKGIKDTIPSELVESHSKLDEAISEITQKLEEQLIDAGKVLKEKENTLEEMTAKYQTTEKAYNELKKNFETVSTLVEKLKSGSDKKSVELVESLQKDRRLMEADIQVFKEEIEKRDKDIAIFIEERKVMESDIAKFQKLVKSLKESLGTCKMNLKKKVKEDEEFADIGSTGDAEPTDLDLPEPDEDLIDIDIDSVGGEYDIESDIESVDSLGLDELDAEGLIAEAEEDDEKEDDEEEMKEEEDDEEDEKEDEEEMKEEAPEEKDEVTEFEDEKEKKQESKKTVKALRSVVKYYKEQVKKDGSIKDIKRQLLTAKSPFEASKLIEKFKESRKEKESLISLKESEIKVPKMTEYKFIR